MIKTDPELPTSRAQSDTAAINIRDSRSAGRLFPYRLPIYVALLLSTSRTRAVSFQTQ